MNLIRYWNNPNADGLSQPVLPLVLLTSAAFLSAAGARSIDPLLGILAREFQTSVPSVSVAIATFTLAYGTSQLLLGPIGDRYGKLRVLLGALTAYTVTMLVCTLATNVVELILLRILVGAASGGLIPVCLAYLGDWIPYERRQVVVSHVLNGYLIGQMLAGPLGGTFGQWLGWRPVFLLLSCAAAIVATWLVLRLRIYPDRRSVVAISYGRDYGRIASDKRARRLLLATLIEGATMAGSFPFIAPFMTTSFGLGYAASGIVLMLFGLGAFIFTWNAKRFLIRCGETGLVILGGILVAGGFTTVAVTRTWHLIALAELILGLGYFTLHTVLQTRATEMLPEARATAVSSFIFMLFMGQSLGTLTMSGVIASLGYRWAFAINAAAIVMLTLWLRKVLVDGTGLLAKRDDSRAFR
jgi:predicted MFS family arabinose efflux permease